MTITRGRANKNHRRGHSFGEQASSTPSGKENNDNRQEGVQSRKEKTRTAADCLVEEVNVPSPAPVTTATTTTQYDVYLDALRQHRLPAILEVIVSWMIAFGILIYYGSVYWKIARGFRRRRRQSAIGSEDSQSTSSADNALVSPEDRLPLVTEAKTLNAQIATAHELHTELLYNLQRVSRYDSTWQPKQLVTLIRASSKIRRIVSKFMKTPGCYEYPIAKKLDSIWMELLELPHLEEEEQMASYMYEISLIVPAYKETGEQLRRTIQWALDNCKSPNNVQVVVVDAGECSSDLRDTLEREINTTWKSAFAEVKVVRYAGGGGRGPSQNYGALCSNGRILTFLHADCLLPWKWDSKVQRVLRLQNKGPVRVNSCAFGFGVDLSKTGWLLWGEPYPWGIRAIQRMVNIRTYLFKMPYGDQAISVPAPYFRYVGGFPNQPMMEDYDLMDFLRTRSFFLNERVTILGGQTCRCSPRRWQKVGVVYMTLANALLVHRYNNENWTPEDVFDYYYLRPCKKQE